MQVLVCGVLLFLAEICIGQQCSPGSDELVIPNSDLPSEGVRLYFQEAGEPILSYLMLRASQIEPTGFIGLMSPTRALWCQSANNNSNNGMWLQPPGIIPPGFSVVNIASNMDSSTDEPYQMVICPGQVGLLRDTVVEGHEGLLQCMISDENNITHTLTVGVYTEGVYDNYAGPVVDSNMNLTLISSRDADPPVFTLTFNSSFGPPTAVECDVNGNSLNSSQYNVSRVVQQPHFSPIGLLDSMNTSVPTTLDVTKVTVTVRVRQSGQYRCVVTVMGRNDSNPQQVVTLGSGYTVINITVSGAPVGVIANRVTATAAMVCWTALSPTPDGYEVFYQLADGGDILSGGTSNNTELTLTGLTLGETYSIFVVAFGGANHTLPSPHSDTVMIQAGGISIANFTSSGGNQVGSTDFMITCTAVVRMTASVLNITIQNSSSIAKNSTTIAMPTAGAFYSVNFQFEALSVSDAGQYFCVAEVQDILSMLTIVNKTLNITVAQTPMLDLSSDNYGSSMFLSGTNGSLTCSISSTNSIILWIKNGNLVVNNGRLQIITSQGSSTIEFTPLHTSDSGQYQCIATVMSGGSVLNVSGEIDLNVTISISSVAVTIVPNDTLYEATPVDIICNVTVDDNVDTPYSITQQWLAPSLLTSGSDYSISSNVLRINRLNVSRDDNRTITCVTRVIPALESLYVLQNIASKSTLLTVTALSNDLFIPDIIIPGVPTAGDKFNITCRLAGVAKRLVSGTQVMLSFVSSPGGVSGDQALNGSAFIRLRMFNSVRSSDSGLYTCLSMVALPGGVLSASTNEILQIEIPSPQLNITVSPSTSPLYETTAVNLICSVMLDISVVNTNITVSSVWTGPSGVQLVSSSRIMVIDMLQSPPYTSVLVFNPVDDMDSGEYQCNMTVSQASNNTAILPSTMTAARSIQIIPVCDEENTTSDQFGSYLWPMTIAGDTHQEQCVFRADYNASRICSQEGSWIAVNFVDCRMIPNPLRNQTQYVRFSSSPNGIFASQSIQTALRTVENVVLEMVNVTTLGCINVTRQPVDAVNRRQRVECTVVGPVSQDQSLVTNGLLSQIIGVLQSRNYSEQGTEQSSELGFCSYESTNEGTRGVFQWNETAVNTTASSSCLYGPAEEMAARQCIARNMWAPPSVTLCRTVVSEMFQDLNKVNISTQNLDSVISNISNVVSLANQTSDQNIDNLRVVSNVLSQSAQVIQAMNVSIEVISNATTGAVAILDSVEEWPEVVVEQQSNQIVQAFDNIVNSLIQQENFNNISVVERDLALRGDRIETTQYLGRTLSVGRSASQTLELETTDTAAPVDGLSPSLYSALSVPREIVNSIGEEKDVRIAFTVYNSPALFPVRNTSQRTTTSNTAGTVVGSQVVSVSVAGVMEGTVLDAPVTFSLRLTNTPDVNESIEFISGRRCVFWDFAAANGNGDWSTSGCNMTAYNGTTDVVSCKCNHLTNFACLVDISLRVTNENSTIPALPEEYLLALDITSIVGVSLSLMGLIIIILTHILFKKFRTKDVTKFHVQLALSMIFFLVVFVAGINRTENTAGCITVGVLLHYLILVTWMWMGAEAVLLFQKLILVFKKTTTIFIIIVSLVCWGLPLLPVIISVSIDRNYYTFIGVSNTTRDFCFISNPGVFFGALLTPILLIIILNVCIFVCATYVIVKLKLKQHEMKKASKRGDKEHRMSTKEATKLMLSLVGFMILLGMSWIIFIFTSVGTGTNVDAAFAFQWLFVFFNSLQGFFICIFFVVISSEARKEWAKLLAPCWFKRKDQSSSRKQLLTSKYSTNTHSNESKLSRNTNYESELVITNASVANKEDDNLYCQAEFVASDNETQESKVREMYVSKKPLKFRIVHKSSDTYDIEIAEVDFLGDDNSDEDTSC